MADELNVSIVVRQNGVESTRQVSQGIREIGASAEQTGNQLPKFYEGVEQAGLKAGGAERGMRRLEYGLAGIATRSLDAEGGLVGASARMAEAGLLFGYGSEAVLAVGGGMAAFGLTLHTLTAPMEEVNKLAAKQSEEFGKVTAALHPGVGALEQVLATEQRLQDIQDAAQPTFGQQLLGTGVMSLIPWNGYKDQIDAQQTLANSADATTRSLRGELSELVAIGETKSLLHNVAEEMRGISDIGHKVTLPGMDFGAVGGQYTFAPTTTGTGLVGSLNDAINKLPSGLSGGERAQAVQQLTQSFTTEANKSIRMAGANLTPLPLLEGMAAQAEQAVRDSGVPKKVADEMVAQIQEELLRAIEENQAAFGPGAVSIAGRARMRAEGVGAGAFTPPTTFGAPFGERTSPGLLTPGLDLHQAVAQTTTTGFSSVGNIKALDDGAKAAAKFGEATDKAADKVEEAGEKLSVSLTRDIGNAVILAVRGKGPAGLLAGASSVFGTLGQERYTADEAAKAKAADPATTIAAGALKNPSFGMASTVLSLGAGIVSALGDLFGNQGLSIKDYGPVALAQLKALVVSGGVVAINVTNSGGQGSGSLQYQIQRNSGRDAIPRFPNSPVGAGR